MDVATVIDSSLKTADMSLGVAAPMLEDCTVEASKDGLDSSTVVLLTATSSPESNPFEGISDDESILTGTCVGEVDRSPDIDVFSVVSLASACKAGLTVSKEEPMMTVSCSLTAGVVVLGLSKAETVGLALPLSA